VKTFTKTKDQAIRANLRAWRDLASQEDVTAGISWYNEAHDIAATI